ncbi:MAG: photosystem II stability/assembly factor-like uncharacterized protein [Rhodothermales bacterium]|jgi:photosystem II stability/assembly factor-like uncharacterized protein
MRWRAIIKDSYPKASLPANCLRMKQILKLILGTSILLTGVGAGPVTSAFAQATTPEAREAGWERHKQMERDSPFRDMAWRAIGPLQAGARVEAIAVPPGNHGTIYAGIGSGNLWKTTNNGITWAPIFDEESTFSIGDVAVSVSDPNVVWVGSGETQPRPWGYSYAGTGVFRSTDAGATWNHMGLADTHHIGKVLIDPGNADVVWVAAIGHFWSRNEERGVFRSRDAGESWEKVLYLGDDTGAVDLVMDPRDSDVVYAATWQAVSGTPEVVGPKSGIHRTTDGGRSWTKLSEGLPDGPMGRMGLDISPSNPNVIYAFIDNGAESPVEGRKTIGGEVYRSDDSGDTWRKTHGDDLFHVFGTSGWKFADVRVSPDNENSLFILGTKAYRSADGGRTFERIGEEILRVHDTRGEVMHLDHHEIWIDPINPRRILLGNDGGLFQSYDGGDAWLHHNNIPAAEFYSVSVDLERPYNVYGGTQDNAALYGPSNTALDGSWVVGSIVDPWENVYLDRWTGGDSFDTLADPTADGVVYYEHQHGGMMRIDVNGVSVQSGGRSADGIAPRARDGEEARTFGWYTPIIISHHDPRTLYAGSNVVLRSRDRGESWRVVSPNLADSGHGERAAVPYGTITFVAESPFRPDRLWAGTEGGTIWRTDDGGDNWQRLDAGLPEKWVSRVIASSHDFQTVYVAMSGFREDDFSAYLYRSTDGGDTWEPIANNLPLATVNVIREDPLDASILYVGTDLGVYTSLDGGETWLSVSATLPTTPVHDLVVHPREAEIVAGTHGRSAFILGLEPVRQHKTLLAKGAPHIFETKPALLPSWEGQSVVSRPGTTYGEAVITYLLPVPVAAVGTRPSVRFDILDAAGDEVGRLFGSWDAGVHSLTWDLVPAGAEVESGQYNDRLARVSPGVYTVIMHAGAARISSTITVLTQ